MLDEAQKLVSAGESQHLAAFLKARRRKGREVA
jgi:hypothetical protein